MRRSPNYKFKRLVLLNNDQMVVHKYDNAHYWDKVLDCSIVENFINLYKWYGSDYVDECRRINNAYYSRKRRLKDRVNELLHSGTCIFLTLEFNDDVLRDTKSDTRRKYVQRYLKSISDKYVANIDFGKENHREHYHALVLIDWIDEKWDYGYIWREKVRSYSNPKKLSKYIAKLTNHAIKETTNRCCYIYSRNK